MKLSDFLVEEIYRLTGTNQYFGYIGGMLAHIVDSIYKNTDTEMINTITEQGAGFAAEGYARANNRTGIALATSGPGATNLVTPVANCFFDSSPVLFITGQVNTYEYRSYDIKQCGFQETNIVDIVKSITKYAKTVTSAQDIKYELQKAIYTANTGRKGPVLLDIPMDIQRAEINPDELKEFIPEENRENGITFDVSVLEKSKKPLILAGNGVNLSDCKEELKTFLSEYNIPIVESLLGVDCVSGDYRYNMGLIGTYGNRYGNLALYDTDCLIVLGSRLDIRQTGGNTDFMKKKTIIHVDIDEKELNCPKFDKIKIKSDIKDFLKYLLKRDLKINIEKWQNTCLKLKDKFSDDKKFYKLPNDILFQIFGETGEDTKITCDVGQNQIWAAQSARIKKGQRLFSSGGHGCMGFSLPAAIGASFPDNKVFAITGDGGMQMNIQELEVIKRRNLPIKIIVLNNNNLGMVRTFQELYFENRCASTVEDYSSPDFAKVAEAYGIKAITINSEDFNINRIKNNLHSKEPVLININFELRTQVEPRLLFGNSIENPHPQISEEEIKSLLDN